MARSKHNKTIKWLRANVLTVLGALAASAILGGGAYFATRKSPQDHFKAGIELHKKGDFKGAAIELKNALQQTPNNADARYLLGRIHFANGDLLNAEKELKNARGLDLKEGDLDVLYARTLLLIDQPQRVLDEVNADAGSAPEINAAILALRARAHLMLKETAATETNLEEADALSPGHPETLATRAYLAFSQGRKDEALAQVTQALAKAAGRSDLWVVKASLLQTLQREDEALQAYAKALAIEPGNVPARLATVQLHLRAAALDRAETEIKELRKYAPGNLMGRYLEALLDFRRGRLPDSYSKLTELLRATPNAFQANLLAGVVTLSLGKREEARTYLNKVLLADPQHVMARKLMAATLADLGSLDEAKKILDSFQQTGNDPSLNMLQGDIALRQGHFAEARKYLENVEDAQRNAKYFANLALSRSGSGDEAGAVQALEKAADLDNTSTRPEVLLVVSHLRANRLDAAMDVVNKLEKERPNDPLVSHLRGSVQFAKNDRIQARASFAKALQTKPDYFPATFSLAQMDIQDKDMKSARSRFEELLKHSPNESRAWLALANLEAMQKNEAGYLKNLEQAKKADGNNIQAHQILTRYWLAKRDAAKALAAAREGLEATKRPEFNELIGLALHLQGDKVNALATFKRWVESSPKNPQAHFRLAQAHIAMKESDAALKSLDKALALRPDFPEAKVSKALVLGQTGHADEAVKIARALQASAPKAGAGFLTEAEILLAGNKPLDAAKLYVKAAQITGQGQPLGRAYQAYALAGQAGEGEKQFELWLKAHPNDTLIRHQLAASLLTAKRLKESADHYRILIRANPKDFMAHNNLAWILGESRDPEAIAIAEQANKLGPDNPATQDTLGWILVNAGQTQRGLDLLKKAVAKAPDALEIHWHLAAGLVKSGDRAKARQELEKLLGRGQKFPQESEARKLLDSLK